MPKRPSSFILPSLALVLAPAAQAAEFHASPAGSGTECSKSSPCKIASFWSKAAPGDALNLENGVYQGNDSMIAPPADYNSANGGKCQSLFGGSPGKWITIRAVSDGEAIIDGQWTRAPAFLLCSEYIALEGMRFQNSKISVVTLNRSHNSVLRRVSAYNANYHLPPDPTACPNAKYDNYHVLEIVYGSTYNLVEDSIFGGAGRNLMNSFGDSNFNIFRRSILVGGGYVRENQIPGCDKVRSDAHGEALQLYGVSDNVIENIVAFGLGNWQGRKRPNQAGVNIWANQNDEAHRNRYYGTLVMDYPGYGFYHASVCNTTTAAPEADSDECLTKAYYENVVAYRNGQNMFAKNGREHRISNATFLDAGQGESSSSKLKLGILQDQRFDADKTSSWHYENLLVAGNAQYGCQGTSNLSPGDVTFDHAMFYGNAAGDFDPNCKKTVQKNVTVGVSPALTSLVYVDSSSPAATAGKAGGAVGADLRCRYSSRFENGTIVTDRTSESMWPLPEDFNERVKAETLEIHGAAYDVNAKVLDALGPRDVSKLKCPADAGAGGSAGAGSAGAAGAAADGGTGAGGSDVDASGAGSAGMTGGSSAGGATASPQKGSDDDGGCGCRSATRRPSGAWLVLGLGFLRLARRRKR